jgi:glutaredoxin
MQELKVYWAPGCTSCLRMKEFLTRHGVSFRSINILENPSAISDLAKIGVRSVPVAIRGNDWSDGQVLGDLARLAGIPLEEKILPPADLAQRLEVLLSKALALIGQIPDTKLDSTLPGRPRSTLQLGAHICAIAEIYLDALEKGQRVEAADYVRYPDVHTIAELLRYGTSIQNRFSNWWTTAGRATDFTATANVYFRANLHQFFERTVWHAAQHTRQLQAVIEALGIIPVSRITDCDMTGLPLPESVYEMPEFAEVASTP